MRLPSFKRIFKQDFAQNDQQLIEKLSFILNNGIDVLYQALNKNLSFTDNIYGSLKSFNVEVDSTGIPVSNVIIPLDISAPAKGLITLKVDNTTNSTGYPSTAPWISWTQVNSGIQVNHISGLDAKNTYTFQVFIPA